MRDRARRGWARLRTFIDENAWIPLAARALGIAASLLLLAAVGVGWFDRALDLGAPRAEAAVARDAGPPRARREARGPEASPPDAASAAPKTPPAAPPGKVVLNTATETELIRLPGVGPARAAAIVAMRTRLGGKFKRFEDLLRVRGIGRRSLVRIREHAVLDPPEPESAPPSPAPSPSASTSARAGAARSPAPPGAPPW